MTVEQIVAPVKEFYSFEESAHSPMFEEQQRFGAIIEQDVLRGTARLG